MNDYIGDEQFISQADGTLKPSPEDNPPFFFDFDEMQQEQFKF